jgi:hypothetical protein
VIGAYEGILLKIGFYESLEKESLLIALLCNVILDVLSAIQIISSS